MCPPGQLVAAVSYADVVADQNIEKSVFSCIRYYEWKTDL